jgi:WD40 repeat protein
MSDDPQRPHPAPTLPVPLVAPHLQRWLTAALAVAVGVLLVLLWRGQAEVERLQGEIKQLREAEKKAEAPSPGKAAPADPVRADDRLRTAQLLRADALALRDPAQAGALLHDKTLFPDDRRDPAWHFYADLCRRAGARLLGEHSIGVPCVAFSHSGRLLATGGNRGGPVHVWDLAMGQGRNLSGGHSRRILALAWSPDDSRLASAGDDGLVLLWDPVSGKKVAELQGHTWRVVGLAWHPDGKTLASAGADGTVRLWDTGAGKEKARWTAGPTLVAMAWDPAGQLLATAGDDNTIRLWDTATRQERAILVGHTGPLHDLAFSPDGRTLASGSADGTVRLWDTTTGKPRAVLPGHAGDVTAVAWHPGGGLLATGGGDHAVRLWSTATGREEALWRGLPKTATSLSWDRDGGTLAISCFESPQVYLWQTLPSAARATLLPVPLDPAGMALSTDGRWLAVGAGDQTVRLADHKSGAGLDVQFVLTAELASPDGHTVAKAGDDGTIRLLHVPTGQVRAFLRGHRGTVTALAWCEGGRFLVSRGSDGTLRLWQTGPAVP